MRFTSLVLASCLIILVPGAESKSKAGKPKDTAVSFRAKDRWFFLLQILLADLYPHFHLPALPTKVPTTSPPDTTPDTTTEIPTLDPTPDTTTYIPTTFPTTFPTLSPTLDPTLEPTLDPTPDTTLYPSKASKATTA